MDGNPQWVLAPDVTVTDVDHLNPTVREALGEPSGGAVVSRPHGRMADISLSADTARLLRVFEVPTTVVDGIIAVAGRDPAKAEQALADALPVLQAWIDKGILVDPEAAAALPLLEPGERAEGCTVVRCLQQLDDSQIYQVREPDGGIAVLKVEIQAAGVGSLRREAQVLGQRPMEALPAVHWQGEVKGHPALRLSWCPGLSGSRAAAMLRRTGDRAGLLRLCRNIAKAYAELHRAGWLHGDVHPRNLLVDRHGAVRLIDFGLASPRDAAPEVLMGRPGVPFYYEPEHARSVRDGRGPLPVSAMGEQFAVCVLLYFLVCGAHYTDFDLYRDTLFDRIADAAPQPFATRGVEPWPDLEDVLFRGLASRPEDRFSSMEALAEALGELATPPFSKPASKIKSRDAVDMLLRNAALDGPWWTDGLGTPPTATIKFGAAGIAFALHRIAGLRGDGEMLALADIWSQRAERDIATEAGSNNPEYDIDPAKVGSTTPFHTASGVAAVQAYIAKARGDGAALGRALDRFVALSHPEEPERDLTLGRCGSLLHCALLWDVVNEWGTVAGPPPPGLEALDALGQRLDEDLWQDLQGLPDLQSQVHENLGMAHGWGGYLYAALQWRRATGNSVHAPLADRLEQLARVGYPQGHGRRWGWRRGDGWTSGAGWCNGSAGFVFLWTLAARLTGESTYRDLAVDAAWTAWESTGGVSSLCCGLTGQSYALLNLAKHSGDSVWVERARHLASRARPDETPFPHSLYKGETGLAVLQADLERPEDAAMPFFEEEAVDPGWAC